MAQTSEVPEWIEKTIEKHIYRNFAGVDFDALCLDVYEACTQAHKPSESFEKWAGTISLKLLFEVRDEVQARHSTKKKLENVIIQNPPPLPKEDTPECDGTDFAHPAWWRGHSQSIASLCQRINEILDGKDDGSGVSSEPWESTRRRLLELRESGGVHD